MFVYFFEVGSDSQQNCVEYIRCHSVATQLSCQLTTESVFVYVEEKFHNLS